MNIAVFTDAYIDGNGGIPVTIEAQRRYLRSQGHKVVIFCPVRYTDKKGRAITDGGLHSVKEGTVRRDVIGVPVSRLIHPYGSAIGKSPETIEKWIEKKFPGFGSRIDLIHVHYEFMCSLAGIRLAKRYGIPLVQTMHGREDVGLSANVPHPFQRISAEVLCRLHEKKLPHSLTVGKDDELAFSESRARMWEIMVNQANLADVVITPSEHFAAKLERYGVKKRKLFPVSNAVEDRLFEEGGPFSEAVVRELKEGEPLKVLWSSRVSKEKRIIPFLRALRMTEHPVEMDVYGGGNQLERAKRFVEAFEMGGRIRFYGEIPHDELMKKMNDAHLCAFVSYGFDTQGMAVLESRAAGLPVLMCDPDLAESAAPGGFILTDGPSPKSMAAALDDIISEPGRIAEMSRACIETRDKIRQSETGRMLVMAYELAVKRKNRKICDQIFYGEI